MWSEDDNNVYVHVLYTNFKVQNVRGVEKMRTYEIFTENSHTHPLILWKGLPEEHQHKQDVTARQQNGEHGRCAVEITGHEISRLAREICANQRPDEKSDRKRNPDGSLKHKSNALVTYIYLYICISTKNCMSRKN